MSWWSPHSWETEDQLLRRVVELQRMRRHDRDHDWQVRRQRQREALPVRIGAVPLAQGGTFENWTWRIKREQVPRRRNGRW